MAKIRKTQPLVPSVLDRLVAGTESTIGFSGRKQQLLKDLKFCVSRDLEHLLNTAQRYSTESDWPDHLAELRHSLADYGIPGVVGANLSTPEKQQRFCRGLEETIEKFEPRLRNVEVTLSKSKESGDRILRFRIEAELVAEPDPIPIVFDSVLEPLSGTFQVEGGSAS